MAHSTHRTNPGRSGLHHRRAAGAAARRAAAAARASCSAKSPIDMGLINDEQLAQALAEQMGMQVGQPGRHRRSRPTCSRMVTEPMAQMYRIMPIELRRQHADGRHVRSAEPADSGRAADVPGLRHPRRGGHRAATMLKALERYYAASSESVESIVADMEDDAELAAAAAGDGNATARST